MVLLNSLLKYALRKLNVLSGWDSACFSLHTCSLQTMIGWKNINSSGTFSSVYCAFTVSQSRQNGICAMKSSDMIRKTALDLRRSREITLFVDWVILTEWAKLRFQRRFERRLWHGAMENENSPLKLVLTTSGNKREYEGGFWKRN